jgi:hypothetical protein
VIRAWSVPVRQPAAAGKRSRDEKVHWAAFHHDTCVDDKMTFAFLKEYGGGWLILAHTQGLATSPKIFH